MLRLTVGIRRVNLTFKKRAARGLLSIRSLRSSQRASSRLHLTATTISPLEHHNNPISVKMFGFGTFIESNQYQLLTFVDDAKDKRDEVYGDHQSHLSHEVIAGGVGFEAMKKWEDHQRNKG